MNDLSNISCSELQNEITKRRKAKESEIRIKYSSMERDIKIKYRALIKAMKLDSDIVKYIKQGAILDFGDDPERSLRYAAYQFEHHQCSSDELFNAFIELPIMLLPEDIINMAERGALLVLKNSMYDEIAKLYT